MVGASNAYNQIIEKDLDALMKRTMNRPIPSGRMTVNTAFTIATILTLVGIVVLYAINPKTAMFGAISIFMYVSLYTPLKTKTPLAVFVGAFPGAIPFMLGWVAATGNFGVEAGMLFAVQFFWQSSHNSWDPNHTTKSTEILACAQHIPSYAMIMPQTTPYHFKSIRT